MKQAVRTLPVIEKDEWLKASEDEIVYRHSLFLNKLSQIEHSAGNIVDYANGYRYFGFQRDDEEQGWWFREWLPGAKEVFLFGAFNDWDRTHNPLQREENGVWSVFLPDSEYKDKLVHGSLLKILVYGDNGWHERIPAYIRRAVQHPDTKNFSGQFWAPPKPFDWTDDDFDVKSAGNLIIYEAHVGMATEEEREGTYREFAKYVLPRIKKLGYNAVQLMAVAEHPYYGSFGYHVSNFFAPSSRFGTPEDLKELIRKAHKMGIAVIMDIVHAHYVKNLNEGLNELDGTDHHYSKPGDAGSQPYWDSKLFDYGKDEVTHFLLSNVKYWLDEFRFDGFRFDGVTSMIYHHHGYTEFDSREKYFDDTINRDGILYLMLANKLVHDFKPEAVTIAEDVSGMPTMCSPVEDGGIGFDYRLAMAVPDFWIKMLKEVPDEQWNVWDIWNIMTNRLPYVKTIAYAESHDQALVGDKTIAFRLMDKEMYTDMNRTAQNLIVDRGIALHKMIRLATISMGGEGYLNFMGNEFGHPEWIDFPREGNGWSYAHARRQWELADNPFLRYSYLNRFDGDMIKLIRKYNILADIYPYSLLMDETNQTMVYNHRDLVFVINWSPYGSIPDYRIPVPGPGRYKVVLSSDSGKYGGLDRVDEKDYHFSFPEAGADSITRHYILIYNVCRTAVVYKKLKR